jgi:hypothetical protein
VELVEIESDFGGYFFALLRRAHLPRYFRGYLICGSLTVNQIPNLSAGPIQKDLLLSYVKN